MTLSISKEKTLRLKLMVEELARSIIPVGKTKTQILSQGTIEVKFKKSNRYEMVCLGKNFLRVKVLLTGMPTINRWSSPIKIFRLFRVKYDKNRTIPQDFEFEIYCPGRRDDLFKKLEEIGELDNFYDDVVDQFSKIPGAQKYEHLSKNSIQL